MQAPLDKTLRNQLERAVIKARDIAELATEEELTRLSVGDKEAADYLNADQKSLRKRLRVHGRALGDLRKPSGEQATSHLVSEVAYEHWHRMLFARFLAENNLLMYEDGVTALSIQDCFDLAEEETGDSANGWRYAAQYAAKMLPQIFRIDSPVFELQFAPNYQKQLEQLLSDLPQEVFTASDSLGWVYQFWQSKKKDAVNASEVKIGADELPAVTQLFTEPYMVSFLLDNSLGAWWAAKQLSASDLATAKNEETLRQKAAIDGVPLDYLRFVQDEDEQGNLSWAPASGSFEAWPKHLAELTTLDPSCGSGHFLVAAFNMLVPLRMADEGLNAQEAVDAVLRDNIHGLELDQRCVELAAFALALSAWKYPNAGGYRPLPEIQVACSGLPIALAKEEWKQLGLGKKNLTIAMDWLHDNFRHAPVLGSLLNPAKSKAASLVSWEELSETLGSALAKEQTEEQLEAAVMAQGMAKAAKLLAGQYQWVITNVPYLARGKQNDTLRDFIEHNYPAGKNDLATAFLDRCLEFCVEGGTSSIVLPQNWLFLTGYKKFREKLLTNDTWHLIARLGEGGFDSSAAAGAFVAMISLSHGNAEASGSGLFADNQAGNLLRGVDVSEQRTAAEKSEHLITTEVKSVEQAKQLDNPDARIALEDASETPLLEQLANSFVGVQSGDSPRFISQFWENSFDETWKPMGVTVRQIDHFAGFSNAMRWGNSGEPLKDVSGYRIQGTQAFDKRGVLVSTMRKLPTTLYVGEKFDNNAAVIIPKDESHLPAIWCFCSSSEYNDAVRRIDQKLNVTNATLVKVPFDLDRWQKVADEKYSNGLPEPYSDDPTQWIFHGHPCGSVVWDEKAKWTAQGKTRIDDTVLQVAVARLLGYRWPAELDAEMELADEQRAWVDRCDELLDYADDDGIVCLPAVRGEQAADVRLEALLQAAYGKEWSTQKRNKLLEAVSCKNQSLEYWLREKFFEQHCKLFQHRPFIWHVWDGLKDGFSALVNYHMLDKKNLERLIYTYLDDWIKTQKHAVSEGIDGADIRLNAAERLKERLELILEGEAPYDIFVRWKSLAEQPVGWEPDLNDGVRMNIRPFMSVDDVGKKGAGILKAKPNIKWTKDRGKDVESAPWFNAFGGDRINDHHLSLSEKTAEKSAAKQ